ncbi:Hpt domain-containing protein [Pseudarthrobacter sp. lyk4-40-TYG-27]|uniref:Hpt domain-containing protein n=1 Tax=Pseudarthrobacter sp. lyk4-40-TYG-27 TaxID=3040305 RepID=UPI0025534560|nr:Hpt domain-containing protein [Pseudarthrobacter sp. lyk4-40-TYG-27]
MIATTETYPFRQDPVASAPTHLPEPREVVSSDSPPGHELPVLDLQNAWDISVDTGGPDLAINFLTDYMNLLHVRMFRILAALTAEDPEPAVNAVLSLKTSSSIAGALEIEGSCGVLLAAIAAGNFQLARVLAVDLGDHVDRMAAAAPAVLKHANEYLYHRAIGPSPVSTPSN